MTDPQIKQYLDENNWEVDAQDCIMKILNTSKQIIETFYDCETEKVTIITSENNYTFELVLGKP